MLDTETIFMLPLQVLRTFDKLISSSVTANMEQAGVKVTKRTQVSAFLQSSCDGSCVHTCTSNRITANNHYLSVERPVMSSFVINVFDIHSAYQFDF